MNTLVYPSQDRPPECAWKVWRESILAAFLAKRISGKPTLHRPLIWYDEETTTTWRDSILVGMSLEEAVNVLPDYLKEAIGNISYPQDNGASLSFDMKESSTCSWTDGTVKDHIGAHS